MEETNYQGSRQRASAIQIWPEGLIFAIPVDNTELDGPNILTLYRATLCVTVMLGSRHAIKLVYALHLSASEGGNVIN